jgi:hypothetical protein
VAKSTSDNTAGAKSQRSLAVRALKGTCVALVTAAVGCGLCYGISVLREQVAALPMYQMSADSLHLVKGPDWMTPAIRAEVSAGLLPGDFPQQFSLLEEDISRQIAAAYQKCIWVERVERVVKHDPRSDPKTPPLEVFLKFRRPIAMVVHRDGFCLVDTKNVRLPGVYSEPRLGAVQFLEIAGVTSSPPAPGEAWADPALQAGVRVVEAVESKRDAFRLVAVDVSNFGGRRSKADTEIVLLTARRTCIKWGKAPSPEASALDEKTPEEKVAYLDFVYKRMNGQVDGVLSYIDIPNMVVRRLPPDTATRLRS